jgi:hypothetical protein
MSRDLNRPFTTAQHRHATLVVVERGDRVQDRLTAFANLANELGQLTISMGGIIVRTRRDRTTYYEDHF